MRTFDEWIAAFHASADPAERERCLDEATASAGSSYEWLQLLRLVADLPAPDRIATAAERALALAAEDGEIWGFRDVARIRARVLRDPEGARAALRAAEAWLATGEAEGYAWGLVADGWIDALDARTRAVDLLRRGLAVVLEAEDIDGLCSIAERLHALGDPRGLELLQRAESLDRERRDAWTIANSWRAVGALDRARQVLDRALASAGTTDDALLVAKAFESHEDQPSAARAASRAEELAGGVGDWLELAETASELGLSDMTRRALGRAEALAEDDDDRRQIATGYHLWLGDAAAADRVGPRGLRPEELRPAVRGLPAWTPSASTLFDRLRAEVSPEALRAVAGSDYGIDHDRHLAALFDLCGTGLVPMPLPWHPREVLELYRWRNGVDADPVARALCCAVLVLAAPDDGLDNTGPVLLESALAMGGEALSALEQLLVWVAETSPPEPAEPADPVALALLAILAVGRDPDDPRLEALADALDAQRTTTPADLARVRGESLRSVVWERLIAERVAPVRDRPLVARLVRWL